MKELRCLKIYKFDDDILNEQLDVYIHHPFIKYVYNMKNLN